jgi:hypothetical protein
MGATLNRAVRREVEVLTIVGSGQTTNWHPLQDLKTLLI